jgi:choline dehydrogenase-like flavoprotein
MREKMILHTGSLRPAISKPSGRWAFNADGEILFGGDHSLTIKRAKEGMEIAHSILKEMGPREITSIDVPVGFTPRTSGSHRVGSCRAGVDPKNSVVNQHFESHEVENMFLCDASVIPRVTTGNSGTPQASVTVFAAGRIVERHFS